MERAERTGLAIAVVGHLGLVALLSLRFMTPPPLPSTEHPIEVSLVQDVGLQQAAPPAPTPPSPSQAPEQGPPEEAAAPAEPAPAPRPAPPASEPKPVPPPPAPKPQPAPRPEPKPEPKPKAQPKAPPKSEPKPVPSPKPKPKPAEKSQPKAEPAAKPAPTKPTPAKPAARPDAGRLASVVADAERAGTARSAANGPGSSAAGKASRARGSRLGSDFLKGLSDSPSKAPPSAAAPGATINAKALADIGSAILRQVQPCANRQVNPGPGAERIRVAINLKLNRDGSLAAPPRVVNHDGVDGENRRYLDRVDDLAIATFTGCAPLKGLPADLYDVPNGWRSFTLRYKLPG